MSLHSRFNLNNVHSLCLSVCQFCSLSKILHVSIAHALSPGLCVFPYYCLCLSELIVYPGT